MRTSQAIGIGVSAAVASIWLGGSAWAQTDPALAGSSSATSSSAVSSLALTAPSGIYPGDVLVANLSQSYGSGLTSGWRCEARWGRNCWICRWR